MEIEIFYGREAKKCRLRDLSDHKLEEKKDLFHSIHFFTYRLIFRLYMNKTPKMKIPNVYNTGYPSILIIPKGFEAVGILAVGGDVVGIVMPTQFEIDDCPFSLTATTT